MQLIDLTSQRFGTYTVCGRAPDPVGAKSAWWTVECDCGVELSVRGDCLKSGKSLCPKCSGGRQGRRPYHRWSGLKSAREIIEANSEFVTECGCQIWTAGVDGAGYGQIRIDGKTEGTHRVSWSLANGPIPEGLFILHRCDTPPCINPDHLFPGTQSDNIADYWAKRRRFEWLKRHYA